VRAKGRGFDPHRPYQNIAESAALTHVDLRFRAGWMLDDPRSVPYLLIWMQEDPEKIVEAVRIAPLIEMQEEIPWARCVEVKRAMA
jgi:hypothetical protein